MANNVIKLNENELVNLIGRIVQEQSKQVNINPKNLKIGSGGVKNPSQVADVNALQQKLIDLKLLNISTGKPTGYFGSKTDAALKRYNSGTSVKSGGPLVKNNNQSDPNSYPACVKKFGKPQISIPKILDIFRQFTGVMPQYQIRGTGFYEGYSFTNDGKYVSLKNNKSGTYRCSSDGKLMLDIADKANNPKTLKSGDYQYSPRVDAEVKHIKNKGMDDAPFFVYDPKENLLFLFEAGGKYVSKTSVIDGGDVQQELASHKAFTTEDWCKINGLDSSPHFCTNKQTKERQDPYMGPIEKVASRFLPKGIYTIKGLAYKKGYAGKSKNTFRLTPITLEGTITAAMKKGVSNAIHGVPNIEKRLVASEKLQKLLQSDLDSGKVPAQYVNSIKGIVEANQSYGCIGIPASFVDSSEVQRLIRVPGFRVFAMGEGADLLVKNTGSADDQALVAESPVTKSVIKALEKFKSKL
jgi:hypothetical protein